MVFGSVMTVIFWVAVIWAVTAVVRRPSEPDARDRRFKSTALEILEQRYARGELTDDDFEAMRHRLSLSVRSATDIP